MIFRRPIKKLAACVAIVGLLFTQLAVSAFACPVMVSATQTSIPATESSETAAIPCHMSHNDGTGNSNTGLCKAHCQDGHKSLSASQTPVALDFAPAFIVNLAATKIASDVGTQFPLEATVPPSGPPIHLRNRVFRI